MKEGRQKFKAIDSVKKKMKELKMSNGMFPEKEKTYWILKQEDVSKYLKTYRKLTDSKSQCKKESYGFGFRKFRTMHDVLILKL